MTIPTTTIMIERDIEEALGKVLHTIDADTNMPALSVSDLIYYLFMFAEVSHKAATMRTDHLVSPQLVSAQALTATLARKLNNQ